MKADNDVNSQNPTSLLNDLFERSLRCFTLKAAFFLRVTNGTERDLVTSYLVSYSALEERELNLTANMVFCHVKL